MSTDSRPRQVARLGRPHGLDGFLGLYVDQGNLAFFEVGSVVLIGDREYLIRAVRSGDKGPQVAFEGVTDRDGAERLRGSDVYSVNRRTLAEGEYWPEDLIGLEVSTTDGRELGKVNDVVLGPTQDRLVVGPEGVEVPLVKELVPTIDLDQGQIIVVSLPGLTAPPH